MAQIKEELIAFGVTIEECQNKIKEHADNIAQLTIDICSLRLEYMDADFVERIFIKYAGTALKTQRERERSKMRLWKARLDMLQGIEHRGAITEYDIQNARDFDILQLISQDIEIKKQGAYYFAPCPFHKEDTASFYVKNNTYYCFGCGVNGDTIKWLMEYRGMGFKDAVKLLVGR